MEYENLSLHPNRTNDLQSGELLLMKEKWLNPNLSEEIISDFFLC